MKEIDEFKREFWRHVPWSKAQLREWAETFVLIVAGLFLLIGGIVAFTGDSSGQTTTFDIVVTANQTLVAEGENISINAYAMGGDGDIYVDESPPPQMAFVHVTKEGKTFCYDTTFEQWEPFQTSIPSGCNRDLSEHPANTYTTNVTIPELEGLVSPEDDIKTFSIVVHNFELNPGFLAGNTLNAGEVTLENHNLSRIETGEEAFLTAGAFAFSGWEEDNVVFLLTILILLTFSAYHGLVGCVFACVLTVPVPIWNELSGSEFPWGFAAFALLYTVMLCIHIAYEYMGGLRNTSERGGMF